VHLYQGRLQGKTLPEIAAELQRSVHAVRKWWRRMRDEGLQGLRTRKPGPPAQGILSHFDPRVVQRAASLKRTHRRWGPDRVLTLTAMRQEPELSGLAWPHRSRLSAFFKAQCLECVAEHRPRPPASPAPGPCMKSGNSTAKKRLSCKILRSPSSVMCVIPSARP
jgi:transposase-like protein